MSQRSNREGIMSEKEWDQLFNLIQKAINLPKLTAVEKGKEIRRQALWRDQDAYLDEFLAELEE